MVKLRSPSFFIPVLIFFTFTSQSEEVPRFAGTIPEQVRFPDRLTEPLFPVDMSIGELGPGEAPMASYVFARRVLAEAIRGAENSLLLAPLDVVTRRDLLDELADFRPRSYRVGSGKEMVDGAITFLFRFVGREKELCGAIYVVQDAEENWQLDDIIPEDARDLSEVKDSENAYPWMPYDRFY